PPRGRNSTAGNVTRINSHRSSGIRHSTGKLRRRRPRRRHVHPPPPRTLRATRGVYYEIAAGSRIAHLVGRALRPFVRGRPQPSHAIHTYGRPPGGSTKSVLRSPQFRRFSTNAVRASVRSSEEEWASSSTFIRRMLPGSSIELR